MVAYKIRVNVEIVECNEPTTPTPQQVNDSLFEFNISPEQAESIDDCEQALLETNYPAIRAALSQHLESLSKKN
jgi:hypothetical protein